MKEHEAMEQGFYYTGIGAAAWEFENAKARAQAIKKAFKGADYRIVEKRCESRSGTTLWKNIYGNEIFRKAQYFNQAVEEEYLNKKHQERLEQLKAEYEEQVAEELEIFNKRKEKYDLLMSLKK